MSGRLDEVGEKTMPRSIAIACQGGGTHTVFTAGVLQAILNENLENDAFEIVALSGTSGGAINALLAWYGLLRDGVDTPDGAVDGKREAMRLLNNFWTTGWPDGNSANTYQAAFHKFIETLQSPHPWEAGIPLADRARNDFVQWAGRWLSSPAVAVHPEISPYFLTAFLSIPGLAWMPGYDALKREFDVQEALRSLLNAYVDFDEVEKVATQDGFHPALLVGAADVLAGKLKLFTSQADPMFWRADGITADSIVASAAIPTVMRGVRLGGSVFWDGLFGQNPPVHDLPGLYNDRYPTKSPDELWIIRINPIRVADEPKNILDIQDRRNEMAGNVSLGLELRSILKMNEFVDAGIISDPRFKHIDIHEIEMSEPIARSLDYLSKVDRKPGLLGKIMDDGERQATAFLQQWNLNRSR